MGDAPQTPMPDWIPRRMSFGYGVTSPHMEADLLEALCEGFVRANQIQIRTEPDAFPCCLGCGKYKYVPPRNCRVYNIRGEIRDPNCQHVYGAFPLDKRQMGTCIDLACMLCAIYREKDGDAGARVLIDHQLDDEGNGIPGMYHALVRKGDGEIVDPQKKAHQPQEGMSVGGPPACECGV